MNSNIKGKPGENRGHKAKGLKYSITFIKVNVIDIMRIYIYNLLNVLGAGIIPDYMSVQGAAIKCNISECRI